MEGGTLSIGEVEQHVLGLPTHSDPDIVFIAGDGEKVIVEWTARRRTLSGEGLTDFVQLYGQIDRHIRLERRDDELLIAVVGAPPSGGGTVTRPPPQPRPTEQGEEKSKGERRARDPERYRIPQRDEFEWVDGVGIHRPTSERFVSELRSGGWDPAASVSLRVRGERLAAVNDFEELLALPFARIDHMPHQEATAMRVLGAMQGRAILADEVGLGKTIEAGLILKELALRGRASQILIICPATLREQWRDELTAKFDEPGFEIVQTGAQGVAGNRLIMSMHLAIRQREALTAKPWDLVIVDEAHRAAGSGARKTHELLRDLESRYRLFLTATPVQNNLLELFRIVQLLRPGTFASEREFKRRFIDHSDPRRPVDPAALRRLVSEVMVRTTRTQAGLDNVTRTASDCRVTLTVEERAIYNLCLEFVRDGMDGPGDASRRRFLAHRMTVSPRALMPVALRMASNHPDVRVRGKLESIAHLCGDLGLGSRERAALVKIRAWVAEHGRVLVFAQHTDTVVALLRALADADIDAVGFHGNMSSSSKAESINRFTRQDDFVPVMVSTDAGAEGLNLQAANCVVNFDLPWNPMRIEQRIGRVHRVTQKRNVHVANLFAVDTIDEQVYWLLRKKLAMFELLFGQVTTVMGELDDESGQTFDGRIASALFASNDAEMHERLNDLGVDLEAARQKAEAAITSGSHLDQWALAAESDAARRETMEAGGNADLRPEVKARQKRRQADVALFAMDLLHLCGCEVVQTRTTSDGNIALVSARVPATWQAAFDGRDELHLAFSHDALEDHPDAELCAVGTEAFDDLLWALRLQGDLTGTVVPKPDPTAFVDPPHADDVRLVRRWVTGPDEYEVRSAWKVRDPENGAEIVELGTVAEPTTSTEALALEPEVPPPTGTAAPDVLERCVAEIREQLAERVTERRGVVQKAADAEWRRVATYFEDQIGERRAEYGRTGDGSARETQLADELRQLRAAKQEHDRRRNTTPELDLQAELIAIDFRGGSTYTVHESWQRADDSEVELTYEWDPSLTSFEYKAEDGSQVEVLAVCERAHVVDASRRVDCPSCSRALCEICGPDATLQPCAVCTESCCGVCRTENHGLCRQCGEPSREPERDTPYRIAWRLGGGVLLRVGAAASDLEHETRTDVLVPDDLVDDELSRRCRALAEGLDLPLDAGVQLVGLPEPQRSPDAVHFEQTPEIAWDIASLDSANRDEQLLPLLEGSDRHVPVVGESDAGLSVLVDLLRTREPPSPPPALVGTVSFATREITITGEGLHEELGRYADGDWITDERVTVSFSESAGALVEVELAPVRAVVQRVHRSILVEVFSPDETITWFAPHRDGVSLAGERAWRGFLDARNRPGDSIVSVGAVGREPRNADFAHPAHATLIARELVSDVRLERAAEMSQPATDDVLAVLGVELRPDQTPLVPDRLLKGFQNLCAREIARAAPPSVVLDRAFVVRETWRGEEDVRVEYPVPGAGPVWPPLDDGGDTAADFTVDSRGHLCAFERAKRCPVCGKQGCAACGAVGQLDDCSGCGRPACGDCRRDHPRRVEPARCERCGTESCNACGRDIDAMPCRSCRRTVCGECRPDLICVSCESLETQRPADSEAIALLPKALAARGLSVRIVSDGDAQVVAIGGVTRSELAVVRNGEVARWYDYATGPEIERDVRIGLAQRFDIDGDVRLDVRAPHPWLEVRADALLIEDRRDEELEWTVIAESGEKLEGRHAGPIKLEESPDPELLARTQGELSLELATRPLREEASSVSWKVPTAGPRGVFIAALRVRLSRVVEHGWVDGDGLHETRGSLAAVAPEFYAWQPIRASWALAGWTPEPVVIVSAESPHRAIALVRLGAFLVLGVHSGGATEWRRVSGGLIDLEQLALGAVLGVEGTVLVSSCTNPELISGPAIAEAEYISRDSTPVVVESAGHPAMALTSLALHAWGGDGAMSFPALADEPVPGPLIAPLARYGFGETGGIRPRVVAVGARVTERWRDRFGEFSVTYELTPGDHQGNLLCEVTGLMSAAVTIDSSRHIVVPSEISQCQYCGIRTCRLCTNPVGECSLCAIAICDECSLTSPHGTSRCPACAGSRVLNRRDAEREGISVPRRGVAVVGLDDVHKLVFVRKKGRWYGEEAFSDGRFLEGAVVPSSPTHKSLDERAESKV